MFYNTGIATYIWLLTNRKPDDRKGKVQLIDATAWFRPLRKNLGKKNCELSPDDIQRVVEAFLEFKETPQSKIFPNAAFGYWKITVERPLRLHSRFSKKAIESLRYGCGDETLRREIYGRFGEKLYTAFDSIQQELEQALSTPPGEVGENGDSEVGAKPAVPEKTRRRLLDCATWRRDHTLLETARKLASIVGDALFENHNVFRERFDEAAKTLGIKISAADRKTLLRAVSWRVESAPPVMAATHKPGKTDPDPLHGCYEDRAISLNAPPSVVEYEPDPELRDTEQVPLLEPGGIETFFRREVLPHVPDAWIDPDSIKIGYEISFTRYFYQPHRLRSLDEIRADIKALENETEGLLEEVLLETKGSA